MNSYETDLSFIGELSSTDLNPSHFDLSPIKKEKLKKEKSKARKDKLRADLPVLTSKEIRRFRLPYYNALLVELDENGFENTHHFLIQLAELQESIRSEYGPGTDIWQRPQLIETKHELDLLTKSLMKAESAHQNGDLSTEWEEISYLAAHYAFGSEEWWWLGEQLLYQCIAMEYPATFQRQQATATYIIGKYLIENGKKSDLGSDYLEVARELSYGKSWNCKKLLNRPQESICIESCKMLHKTFLEQATLLRKTDPHKAIELCTIARKRASESCDHQGEFEALILKGKCEMAIGDTSRAIATVMKSLLLAKRKQQLDEICEALISLALAYAQHGKLKESLECLKELKNLADENNLPFYLAQAYRFMGEYYLNMGQPYEATPLLMLAFYLFHENNDLGRREKVRNWAAISAGEELFLAYIELIKSCNNNIYAHENIIKLINWIDDREYFWTQETHFSFSYFSLQESLQEKITNEEVISSKLSSNSQLSNKINETGSNNISNTD